MATTIEQVQAAWTSQLGKLVESATDVESAGFVCQLMDRVQAAVHAVRVDALCKLGDFLNEIKSRTEAAQAARKAARAERSQLP